MELTQTAPHNIELEEIFLGQILIDQNYFFDNKKDIYDDLFYIENHKSVFNAIKKTSEVGSYDFIIVTQFLRANFKNENDNWAYFVTNLTAKVSSTANFLIHLYLLKELQYRRVIINNAYHVIQMAQNLSYDIDEIYQNDKKFAEKTSEILDFDNENRNNLHEILADCINDAEQRQINLSKNIPAGIQSGLSTLDRITHGWRAWNIILAARPSMGKTALSMFFAKNAAFAGKKVVFFSLEMNKNRLGDRLITSELKGITNENFKTGRFTSNDWNELFEIQNNLSNLNIKIYDRYYSKLNKLISKIKKLHRKGEVDFVIIDYVQLIISDMKHNTRNDELTHISRELFNLKNELDIPFLILSQLNREVDTRPKHIPVLKDLRESGSLEQDADMVLFLVRPAYYSKDENDKSDFLQMAKFRDDQIHDLIIKHDSSNMNYFDSETGNELNDFILNSREVDF